MQIDFHHAVTYVVARLAGFANAKAEKIAYCAQYVDDATNSGTIKFNNDAMYTRISSAHKTLDYRNFEALANHHVWIPFHFLPGNGSMEVGQYLDGTFIEKLKCKPGSFVAKDMIRTCIEEKDKQYGLHRLGITMHVYADTWAHQGFSGVIHETNNVRAIDDNNQPEEGGVLDKMKDFFGDLFDKVTSKFVDDLLPLGHGAALSYPDLPYLKWDYIDYNGERVTRKNTDNFIEAANEMCKAMQRFRKGDPDADVAGLHQKDRDKIYETMKTIPDSKSEDRHKKWLELIREGYFSFGAAEIGYKPKGDGSWKHKAIKTKKRIDADNDTFPYSASFLKSDWKLFHDALMAHRFYVVHDLLPKYDICAA